MRRALLAAVVVLLAAGLGACGNREREALRNRVTALEQQRTRANADLVASQGRMAGLEEAGQKLQDEVVKCKVERDQLKAEIKALKRKYGAATRTTTKSK